MNEVSTWLAKREAIAKLIEAMGIATMVQDSLKKSVLEVKGQVPGLPATFWTAFETAINIDELVDLLVPVFDQHYTAEDIEGITRFYTSPVGLKMVRVSPALLADATEVGERWAQNVLNRGLTNLLKGKP